jgi:rare lipoprotein A
MKKIIVLFLTLTFVAGCVSNSRYSMRHDSGPVRSPTQAELNDATPVHLKPTGRGNANYEVFGKRYFPMATSKGFSQTGEASWYGRKFHGHLTSNGEIYDMFGMSAAHKTLPIPSYARVTNLANNKQVIVRVNDRGPFHGDRILDLSYSAATKLDMLKTGTAKIQLDVIHVEENGNWVLPNNAILPENERLAKQSKAKERNKIENDLFIQVAALSNKSRIDEMAKGFSILYQVPTLIAQAGSVHKLQLGPLSGEQQAEELLNTLKLNGYEQAFKFYAQ